MSMAFHDGREEEGDGASSSSMDEEGGVVEGPSGAVPVEGRPSNHRVDDPIPYGPTAMSTYLDMVRDRGMEERWYRGRGLYSKSSLSCRSEDSEGARGMKRHGSGGAMRRRRKEGRGTIRIERGRGKAMRRSMHLHQL